jgi:transcription initiation factor IIF auxiliary subunit
MKRWLMVFFLLTLLFSGCQAVGDKAKLENDPSQVFEKAINKTKATADKVNAHSAKLEKAFPVSPK